MTLTFVLEVVLRGLVPKDIQYEMAHGESNGYVTDDVT